jgi:glycosyltransferase involved in cell wall biosynthesis
VIVSVVIPVFNGETTLKPCLTAVFRSDLASYEVIVVDDASTDGSATIARQFPCCLLVMDSNRGAAACRNRGAQVARGSILFFLDADIVIESNTLSQIVATFHDQPDLTALFCSYQPHTPAQSFWSQYKNLVHHFTHQTSATEAATFCGGFGAIKRHVFLDFSGFDEGYRSLEDIELGYRLHQAGHRIFLNKAIQVTHLKEYSLHGLIESDVAHRAIPWTKIMLDKRVFRNDLNTKSNNVLSVLVAFLLLAALGALAWLPSFWWVAGALLIAFITLNRNFLSYVWRERGAVFTLKAVAMSWFIYLYSGVGLVLGVILYLWESLGKPSVEGEQEA